ncbi:VOC family protein [Bacillus alkalicellulosilyticus]|uniref:VOC family protein n=1 Tax=Alkalihalobacterium alkalicellulosilyticum TaxID=1912214 RepID=UPI000996E74C|nr:VOC family protein [Bacillus alkalicellulosilyticus]
MKILADGVSEIVLEVKSMERAIDFWSNQLGFPIVEQWGYKEGQFDISSQDVWATWLYIGGSTRLGLWLTRNFTKEEMAEKRKPVSEWEGLFDEGGSHVHFALYIRQEHFDEAIEVLKKEGIDLKLIEEETLGIQERRLYFKDTEENIVEFYTRDMKNDYKIRFQNGKIK